MGIKKTFQKNNAVKNLFSLRPPHNNGNSKPKKKKKKKG